MIGFRRHFFSATGLSPERTLPKAATHGNRISEFGQVSVEIVMPPRLRTFTGRRIAWLAVCAYPAWLAMLGVHESGHVLHAWLSGGTVERVELPLLGFSRTDVFRNPRPHFVAWGGPLWGAATPLLLAVGCSAAMRRSARGAANDANNYAWNRLRSAAWTFCGFCLVANGAYLSAGAFGRVGDAGDLLRHGTPFWALTVIGAAMLAAGLTVWHCLAHAEVARSGP